MCGFKAENVQKRLLTERDLTVTKAVELANGMEAAAADVRELNGRAPGGQNCHRRGKSDHDGWSCRYRKAKCHKCDKTGHIAPVCRSGAKNSEGNHKGHHKVSKAHHVGSTEEQSFGDLPMHAFMV